MKIDFQISHKHVKIIKNNKISNNIRIGIQRAGKVLQNFKCYCFNINLIK